MARSPRPALQIASSKIAKEMISITGVQSDRERVSLILTVWEIGIAAATSSTNKLAQGGHWGPYCLCQHQYVKIENAVKKVGHHGGWWRG